MKKTRVVSDPQIKQLIFGWHRLEGLTLVGRQRKTKRPRKPNEQRAPKWWALEKVTAEMREMAIFGYLFVQFLWCIMIFPCLISSRVVGVFITKHKKESNYVCTIMYIGSIRDESRYFYQNGWFFSVNVNRYRILIPWDLMKVEMNKNDAKICPDLPIKNVKITLRNKIDGTDTKWQVSKGSI